MKKIIVALSLLTLIGAGCVSSEPAKTAPANNVRTETTTPKSINSQVETTQGEEKNVNTSLKVNDEGADVPVIDVNLDAPNK